MAATAAAAAATVAFRVAVRGGNALANSPVEGVQQPSSCCCRGAVSVSWVARSGPCASSSQFLSGAALRRRTSAWQSGGRREAQKARTGSASASAGDAQKEVLVINTSGGGHAAIGFYLAKDLVAAGYGVTVFTVGEQSSDKNKKPPFSRFSELTDIGVKTTWGDPSSLAAVFGAEKFDVVLDNNGKDLDTVKPVADWAKGIGAQQFLFISSAGIYNVTDEPPHVEGDAIKSSAGHAAVEEYLKGLGFESWASFRPQYMLGSGNNKDCEEWFFDRIVRGRPVPIPDPGMQLTNIARISDVSAILTLAVQKPEAANGQIFNAVSDRAVTLAGLARLAAKAAGKDVEIVLYNPKAVGVDAKKAFPFRITHFYAEPRAAKDLLGFVSKTNLPEDLKERYEEYVKIGRDKKDLSSKFELDDKILDAVKQPVAA